MRFGTLISDNYWFRSRREIWFNVYFGVYGSGEPYYSPALRDREQAETHFFPIGQLAYRIRVIAKGGTP